MPIPEFLNRLQAESYSRNLPYSCVAYRYSHVIANEGVIVWHQTKTNAIPKSHVTRLESTTRVLLKPQLLTPGKKGFAALSLRKLITLQILRITRSILSCADAILMRCHQIRPIRISGIGGFQIVHDSIPLSLRLFEPRELGPEIGSPRQICPRQVVRTKLRTCFGMWFFF